MSFFGSMDASATGLSAQRLRLDIISQNLANVNTTKTANGGPYKRKGVIFEEISNTQSFQSVLEKTQIGSDFSGKGVRVAEIFEDQQESPLVYDPSHPDANEEGYVAMPNVNSVEEMINMISANRSYEANVRAFNSQKAMITKALEIGK